ncbi:hypothetical protein AVEN_22283-1 [Araneus ventricosus]|uniref:Uncharacterized protein n=1 Tax=Araneus ventricosus TaxID=182803 RepID=A0A4Y2HU95_ARAVE|nr:hypothetical protein AVEN_22283-1 [Araneus ventricosus]
MKSDLRKVCLAFRPRACGYWISKTRRGVQKGETPFVRQTNLCCCSKIQHSRISGSASHQMAPPIRGTTQKPNAERRRLVQSTKDCVERERRRWKQLMAVQATPPK